MFIANICVESVNISQTAVNVREHILPVTRTTLCNVLLLQTKLIKPYLMFPSAKCMHTDPYLPSAGLHKNQDTAVDHCSLCFFCIPYLFPLFLPHKEPPIHPLLLMSSYFSPQPSSASCLGNRAGGLQGQCSGCESYKWYLYQYLCLVLTGSWGQRSVWAQTHLMDKAQLLHQLWMAQGTEQLLLIFPSPSP